MNKFLMYILPFIGGLLFSCSQQSEASYVEEVDEVEMSPGLETFDDELTYYWESEDTEQQVDENFSNLESNEVSVDDIEQTSGGASANEKGEISGFADKDQSDFITKEKALKAFVKTNVEDVLDLISLYKANSQEEEMSAIAQLAIEEYLEGITFQETIDALKDEYKGKKNLKLFKISQDETGNYEGEITIKNGSGTVLLKYKVVSTATEYGLNRKFQLVGIQ